MSDLTVRTYRHATMYEEVAGTGNWITAGWLWLLLGLDLLLHLWCWLAWRRRNALSDSHYLDAAGRLLGPQELRQLKAIEAARSAKLRALPTRTLGAEAAEGAGAEEGAPDELHGSECCVCMEALAAGDVVRQLPCAHTFHKHCADRWLLDAQRYKARSCPLCKANPLDAVDGEPSEEAAYAWAEADAEARQVGIDERPPRHLPQEGTN